MLMAWSEQDQLTERFHAVRSSLDQACKHWNLGSSYSGWVAALQRETPRLVPLIKQRLRRMMLELPCCQGRWRHRAFAVDVTQIACPRTLENQQAMGDVGKPDGMPLMSLTGILHLGTGLPWDFRLGPGTDSERTHLREMLDDLPPQSLLVADGGFVGYDLCQELIRRKQHFLLRVGGNVHLFDSLGYAYEIAGETVYLWPAYQRDRSQPPLQLRLIMIRDESKQPIYVVTSLSASELSEQEARDIYHARWGVEVQYRTLKQTMQHHTLRSRTPHTCYLEMTWALFGVWLLQLMTARRIVEAGGDACQVSPARARNCVRRVLRNQSPCTRSRQALGPALARCQLDSYTRRRPKTARKYPRKKRHEPPKPPNIKPPNKTQLRKAKQLTPIRMLI